MPAPGFRCALFLGLLSMIGCAACAGRTVAPQLAAPPPTATERAVVLREAWQTVLRERAAREERIFARLLEVMSDPQLRGKVVWIAASNRPDLIDPAIKRSGRLDYKIPVLPPEPEERLAILQTQLRRYEVTTIDLGQLDASTRGELLRHTEGWTGAELEKVVLKALDLAEDNGEDRAVTIEDMREALTLLRPSTKNIELMTKLALAEVDDLTLVPARYRSLFNDRAAAMDRPAEEVVQTRGPRSL